MTSTDADTDPDFVTIREVCDRYRLRHADVARMVRQGEFPAALILTRRKWLFKRRDVETWESRRWLRAGDGEDGVDHDSEDIPEEDSIRQPRALRPAPLPEDAPRVHHDPHPDPDPDWDGDRDQDAAAISPSTPPDAG